MSKIERRAALKAALFTLGSAAVVGIGIHSCKPNHPDLVVCYMPVNPGSTRHELVQRLERLAQSEPPKDLSFGAMCYDMASPIIEEVPCPDCQRTKIVGEKDEILREYNVPLIRIQDRGIPAILIPPKHCPDCGDGLKDNPFQLEIQYDDLPTPHRVELTNGVHDLELMALFLQGKDRLKHSNDAETPLKDKLPRLHQLFGIKEEGERP